jgi:hypothetical protein
MTLLPSPVVPKVPSSVPSSEPTPARFQNTIVFACGPEGFVVLAQPPLDVVTVVPINVGYLIESSNPFVEYIDDVERRILVTAVAGALQCNTSGPLFGKPDPGRASNISSPGLTPYVPMNTTVTGETCNASVSACTVLETDFQFVVNKHLDPEVAAFLGYVSLREDMDSGAFAFAIPSIDRSLYLSPLPLLPPVVGDDNINPNITPAQRTAKQLSVSPYTVGTVSALCKLSETLRRVVPD